MPDRALLFDLDGTLIHSDPLHEAVFVDFLAARGVELGAGDYARRIHGRLNLEIFAELLPGEDARHLSELKEAEFRRRLEASTEDHGIAGAAAFLRARRAEGWKTAVVTNAPPANAPASIAAVGLTGLFDTVVAGEDCSAGKPDPAPYREALRRLGVAARDAVAFEDSPSGLSAAIAAGIPTVGLASSLDASTLLDHGVQLVVRDFTDPALEAFLAHGQGALT
jgi:HAD superfamily hydrolase (TIGR01509 family)